jgi:hypothetical protein
MNHTSTCQDHFILQVFATSNCQSTLGVPHRGNTFSTYRWSLITRHLQNTTSYCSVLKMMNLICNFKPVMTIPRDAPKALQSETEIYASKTETFRFHPKTRARPRPPTFETKPCHVSRQRRSRLRAQPWTSHSLNGVTSDRVTLSIMRLFLCISYQFL